MWTIVKNRFGIDTRITEYKEGFEVFGKRSGFVAILYFKPAVVSLGIQVHLSEPTIEVHLPFCFLRVGRQVVGEFKHSGWILEEKACEEGR